jgi:mRNA interferase MazF
MVIRQGEIYWVDFGEPIGSMPGFERPCVIVQNSVFNASGIATVIVAAITSNLRLA